MDNKKLILFIFLMAFLGTYWFFYHRHSTSVISSNPSQPLADQDHGNRSENTIEKIEQVKKNHVQQDKKKTQLIQLFSQKKFSDDPFVEALIVVKLDLQCNKGFNFQLLSMNAKTSEKQLQSLERFQQRCRENQLEFKEKDISELFVDEKMALMTLALESKYSDLVQKAMTMEFMSKDKKLEFFDMLIDTLIKSRNGYVISLLSELLEQNEGRYFINDLSNHLGITDHHYTKMTARLAIQLFSCQYSAGETCSENSAFMIRECIKYEAACGLTIPIWFQQHYTKAHNRDINKLVKFFVQRTL